MIELLVLFVCARVVYLCSSFVQPHLCVHWYSVCVSAYYMLSL